MFCVNKKTMQKVKNTKYYLTLNKDNQRENEQQYKNFNNTKE